MAAEARQPRFACGRPDSVCGLVVAGDRVCSRREQASGAPEARSEVGRMFELFTDEARDAVMGAQIEARELAHDHVGAEHLLLGLLRLPVERETSAVALEPA